MNQPDRYSRFILSGDKVSYRKDDKVQDAGERECFIHHGPLFPDQPCNDTGTFTINNEDHTVGNLVRMQLHEDKAVVFAGYRIPHPLENKMLVMISTDGSKSPVAAMGDTLEDLKLEFQGMRDSFAAQAAAMMQQQHRY